MDKMKITAEKLKSLSVKTELLDQISSMRKRIYGMYPILSIDDIQTIISSTNDVQKNIVKSFDVLRIKE